MWILWKITDTSGVEWYIYHGWCKGIWWLFPRIPISNRRPKPKVYIILWWWFWFTLHHTRQPTWIAQEKKSAHTNKKHKEEYFDTILSVNDIYWQRTKFVLLNSYNPSNNEDLRAFGFSVVYNIQASLWFTPFSMPLSRTASCNQRIKANTTRGLKIWCI